MFLLDFHYSDTWADPGKQHKPCHGELSYPDLVKKIRSILVSHLKHSKKLVHYRIWYRLVTGSLLE